MKMVANEINLQKRENLLSSVIAVDRSIQFILHERVRLLYSLFLINPEIGTSRIYEHRTNRFARV
jgi:hypothetical protein